MFKTTIASSILILTGLSCTRENNNSSKVLEAKDIKAYCIDFNWGDGGPNAFAAPGLWAGADPEALLKNIFMK